MKKFKKLVALLLAMMMVFSIAPVAAFAEGYLSFEEGIVSEPTEQKAFEQEIGVIDLVDPDGAETYDADSGSSVLATVIACSDFQNRSGDSAGAAKVKSILNQMKNNGIKTADGLICAGDYSIGYSTDANTLSGHITSFKNAVEGVYGTSVAEVFCQGNHDQVTQGTGGLTGSGAHDEANYGVYVIDEDDYMWRNSGEARIKQTAENLSVYLAAKIVEKYAKPIFVVSHLPLHYNMRTKNDGDGKYANYIFDVLNAAGENGLNIIFLYGHDHSNGWDDYLGGSCVYLAKGDEINIAQSSQTDFAVKTLNFSYLNAGFVGYYENHNGADDTLTMTAFKIYSDKVVVSRYSDSGVHNLKCKGVTNSYKNESGYGPNTTVYESPKTIALATVTPPVTVTKGNVSVTAAGLTGLTATKKTVTFDTSKYSAYASYDINPEGYTQGDNATVKITLDENDGFDTSRKVTVIDKDGGNPVQTVSIVDGKVTFTTNHFSTYDIAQEALAEPTERTYTRVTSTSELESGKQYLLIYNSDKDYFMCPSVVTKSNDSGSRTGFDVFETSAAGPDTITGTDYIGYEWTLTSSGSGWLLGKGDTYAKLTSTSSNGITATLTSNGSVFTVGGSADNFTFSSGNYVLNHNARGLINGYESNAAHFYIYKLTEDGGSTEPSEPTSETIYMFVGQTVNRTISGEYLTTSTNNNPTVVGVTVTGTPEQQGEDTYTSYKLTINKNNRPSDSSNWTATEYFYLYNGKYYPVYIRYYKEDKDGEKYRYRIAYYKDGNYETAAHGEKNASATVYIKHEGTTVPASTNITFNALAAGTSVVTVGTHTYTIIVREKAAANDYPEYPNEGSVRVEKTGQGVDFQETGVAKIELSTTGVPMTKGVDVILMLDTSSSMNNTVDGSTRIDVLRDSVANMLATFNTPDSTTGFVPDIKIAIADFNGYYYSDGAVYLDENDHLTGGSIRGGSQNNAKVYTGSNEYNAAAFVPASTYNTPAQRNALVSSITTASGTNYDYAFYSAYQLGNAIKAANSANEEERDLYVVFMSDGAPFQYNGFSAQSSETLWNNWLQGTANNAESGSHRYFYNENGNRNWWAEAIKGDEAAMYTVIDKTSTANYGGNQYMTQVAGLDAKMYSIGFCLEHDTDITVASMENVLQKIATDQTYYYKADSAADLNNAFVQIAGNIKKAGYNAEFVDTMGEAFDLQIKPITKLDGTSVADPKITVSTYALYKHDEVGTTVNGVTVTAEMVGTRKSNTPVIQETVTFNADGTEAYSDKLSGNILTGNKINAKLFTYDFATETFSWNVGDITEDEQVLTYYVYLTGSKEGTRAAGSYPTNKSAVLNYMNWLDHDAHKDTVSPVMAWKSASVSYAFYLVDDNGNPIVNQTTGLTGSFANAVKVTQPVVYSEVLLNSTADVEANLVAKDILPAGYVLYDSLANYVVAIKSSGEGSWIITKGAGAATATTYVAQYDVNDSAAVTNELNSANVNDGQNDYTHTVVWFAVKYQVSTVPDAVVIDFGLPVDISVLANDILGENASVEGLAANVPEGTISTEVLADGFVREYTGTYGTAVINGKKVRYTPNNMEMNNTEKFAYAAKAAMESDSKYYYSTVTVIPAANVYYEDSFVTFNNNSGEWVNIGQTEDGITQQEDRPGKFSLTAYDANNVYGYDAAYKDCSQFSLGSAKKVTVSASTNANAPTAVFTFTGTGFDLISLTSNRTGTILVDVIGNNGVEKHWIVDTYYGYVRTWDETNPYIKCTWTYSKDGEWHVVKEEISELPAGAVTGGTPAQNGDSTYEYNYKWTVVTTENEMDNALYQIPVIRGQGLEYGTYTVTVTPKYSSARDHYGKGSYDFYLDAVRVYDPAGTNPGGEIGDAHKADGEGWPDIIEIRNKLIDAETLSENISVANGIVFVDGAAEGNFTDYVNYGPNNEVYLAKNQAVAFKITVEDASKIASIQIAGKAPTGTAGIAQINEGTATPIASATEMYYDITHRITWSKADPNTSETIVLANVGDDVGDGLLSATNIKITYKEAPASYAVAQVDQEVLVQAPFMLMRMLKFEAPVQDKTFEPEMFEVSLNKIAREGQNVTMKVKASTDVEAIEVDGVRVQSYITRSYRIGFGRNAEKVTYREFKYSFTASESKEFAVTAIDAEGTASEPVTAAIKVQQRKKRSAKDWFNDLFGGRF